MPYSNFEVLQLNPTHSAAIWKLFSCIILDDTANSFHPHTFTLEQAHSIANSEGKDIYLGLFEDCNLIGYGMLRGWDEGYEIPSLGIYISPPARGKGLSKFFMKALHNLAYSKGARKVRLKVYRVNAAALHLYQSMGYKFDALEQGQLVGYCDLSGGNYDPTT